MSGPVGRRFWAAAVACAVILGLGGAFVQVAVFRVHRLAAVSSCAHNLKQLALAATQYSDDKGAYPHVRGPGELDGDATTSDGPRCFRALSHFGYVDDPARFVCPTSPDRVHAPIASPFGWGGRPPEPGANPLAVAASCDAPLTELRDLSYAYTRASVTRNTKGTTPLMADRRRGHHLDGTAGVARVDNSVAWVPDLETHAESGQLGVLPEDLWIDLRDPVPVLGVPVAAAVLAAAALVAKLRSRGQGTA